MSNSEAADSWILLPTYVQKHIDAGIKNAYQDLISNLRIESEEISEFRQRLEEN